ncbi:uncharacterized protein METZ01_LOCUS121334 [marine metagenome]|uniref:Uncharacterized protein n=1 Tax=marine metagenome TaxID=408172 RepID=A0A381XV27_9ZZZZ
MSVNAKLISCPTPLIDPISNECLSGLVGEPFMQLIFEQIQLGGDRNWVSTR